MAKTTMDKYANKAYGIVTMSAANTMTFAQIQFGVGLFEGKALVLHRILYYPTNTAIRELVAATDSLHMAITTTNRLTDIVDVSDPAIIDRTSLVCLAANTEPVRVPIVADFTSLPGGGKLCPANPIWIGANTGGAAAASVVRCTLEFTFVELSPADYLEVIQSMFPANIA